MLMMCEWNINEREGGTRVRILQIVCMCPHKQASSHTHQRTIPDQADGCMAWVRRRPRICTHGFPLHQTGLPLPSPFPPRRSVCTLASRRLGRTPAQWRPSVRRASPPPHTNPAPIHAPTHARTEPPHPPALSLACHPAPCPPASRATGLVATRRASPPRPPPSPRPPPTPPLPHPCNHSPRARRACPSPT
jgi:hypothetical protein